MTSLPNPAFAGLSVSGTMTYLFSDPDGQNPAVFNVRSYGMSPSASAAANRTALISAIAAACAASGRFRKIYIPAGQYFIDVGAGDWSIPALNITVAGDGPTATVLIPTGTGNAWHVPVGFGAVAFQGFEMYRADNVASGNFFLLEQGECWIDSIDASGAFGMIEILSAATIFISNVNCAGANTSSGSYGLLCHRLSNVAALPAEVFIANSQFRSTVDYGIILRACDGFMMTNGQAAFARVAGMLVQPEYLNDQISMLKASNWWFETQSGTHAVHCVPQAGQIGYLGLYTFSGCMFATSSQATVLMADPAITGAAFTGCTFLGSQTNGFSATAGEGISLVGNIFQGNDISVSGAADIAIAGTVTKAIVSNNTFSNRGGLGATSNVAVSGTADYVTIGHNSYNPTATTTASNTSSGAHNLCTTMTGGAGAPTSTQPLGSTYTRSNGGVGTTMYVSRGGGTWNPVAGV